MAESVPRGGSSVRAGSSGTRTGHDRDRFRDRLRDRDGGPLRDRWAALAGAAGTAAPDWASRARATADAAPPGCTRSPCSSGSSTGTPRRTAHRPHGACGTAGRAPARRWARRQGAGAHRGHQGHRDRTAGASRAADSRNRRRAAAGEGAEARHRPCGDRRPRTSRRNPTGVRSGRSACRRFPLSFSGRCDRVSPVPRGNRARYFFTRTVFVDRVSRVISSASSTLAFNRTVPATASTTSTTFASSFAVSALPDVFAS